MVEQNINILIAEDNIVNLHFIKKILQNAGYKTETAENGKIAFNMYEKNKFDLVITDFQMPEMNGIELIKAIRQKEADGGSVTGMLVLTGESSGDEMNNLLEAGADSIIKKPVKGKDILETIQVYLDNSKRVTREKNEIVEDVNCVNNDSIWYLYNTYPGDKNDVFMFIDLFFQNYPSHLENIKKAVHENDPINLKLTSHKFKGMVAMFYETELIEKLASLESLAMEKKQEKYQQAYNEMTEKLDGFIKKLNEFKAGFSTASKG